MDPVLRSPNTYRYVGMGLENTVDTVCILIMVLGIPSDEHSWFVYNEMRYTDNAARLWNPPPDMYYVSLQF